MTPAIPELYGTESRYPESVGFTPGPGDVPSRRDFVRLEPGLVAPGNYQGQFAGTRSFEFADNGIHTETLLPALSEDEPDSAILERYQKTGEHLGKFETPEDADAYANRLALKNTPVAPSPVTALQAGFLQTTSVGRVLNAFGAGAAQPFEGDYGLGSESTQWLRDVGVFKKDAAGNPFADPIRTFNEAIILPAAADLDALFRATISPFTSLAQGLGQISEETGLATSLGYYRGPGQANEVREDILGAIDTMGIVMGTHLELPVGPAVSRRNRIAASERLMGDQIPTGKKVQRFLEDEYGGGPPDDLGPMPLPDEPPRVPGKVPSLVVARKLPDGSVVYGKPGGIHADLLDEVEIEKYGSRADHLESQMGFATGEGAPFMSRTEASAWVKKHQPGRVSSHPALAIDDIQELEAVTYNESAGRLPPPPPPPDNPPLQPSPPPPQRKAGNINLDRINAPEDVKQVILDASLTNDEFMPARRGRMTFEDIEGLADSMGMTPAQLTSRKVGQAFNAEEAVAARNLLVASAEKVRELAKAAQGGGDEAMAAFQQAITRHAAIQEQVAGMTAEAGRALASFNIKSEATDRARQLSGLIEAQGGRDTIQATIEAVLNLDSPQKVSKLTAQRLPTTADKVVEAWINGLLSGPVSHVKNIVSNSVVAVNAIAETAVAAQIGNMRRGLGSTKEHVYSSEVRARAFGMIQGAKDGIRAARVAFSEAEPAATKVDAKRKMAIGGRTGRIVRIPTRFLSSQDAFFRAIGKRQEIEAQAYRIAEREGHSGSAWESRVAELIANPTSKMIEAADKVGDYQTFTQNLGNAGKAVQSFFNSNPVLKFVAPFIRTPVNIVKYAGERTPLGLFSREVRDNLAGKNGSVAQDTQAARLMIGTSATIAAFGMAANGQITGGGPTDPRARAELYMTGWAPYSARVGDSYYSYAWIEPYATWLGVAADAYEIQHTLNATDASDLGGLVLASASKNLLNKTWLQGPADLLQAVEDPERYGSAWVRGLTSSFVPTGIAQMARAQDPYLRDARSILDGFKARVPFLSEQVPVKRDLWGEAIRREGALGPDILSPVYMTQIKDDIIAREMLRLGIWKAQVPRNIRGVELDAKQYDDFQRVAGRLTRYSLQQIVGQEGWSQMPSNIQTDIINRTFDRSRESARNYIMTANPELLQSIITNRVQEVTGQKPNENAGQVIVPETVQ